jgi:hypothetical protein
MSSLTPVQGYVEGSTLLKIEYSYFYEPSSLRAVCKFTSLDGLNSHVTRIISYTSTYITCFTPPADLIDQVIYDNGGVVTVSISSNNRDFSDEYFEYTYLPTVEITTMTPLWIINNIATTV